MDTPIGYTPQTRRLRRIVRELLDNQPTQQQALQCPDCNRELKQLPRARVFANRADGQRFRCVGCGARHILFIGRLLRL